MLIGAGLGMAAATGVLPVVNGSTGGRFPPLFVSGGTWLLGAGLAVAVGLAIGLPPALRARRLKIVDALAGHR
jgi:putative ABC transport system permease protein